jgi:hypothetical protein
VDYLKCLIGDLIYKYVYLVNQLIKAMQNGMVQRMVERVHEIQDAEQYL